MDYSIKENIIEVIFEKVKYLIWPSRENNYECKFLQSNALLSLAMLLLVVQILASALPINFISNIFFADLTKVTLENSANQTRQSLGLAPLADSQKLDEAALLKAQNMIQNGYFSHTSPSGLTPWYWFGQVGYNYQFAGENLAVGFYESQEVYNAWMNSPSHRENLLNPNYKEVGTAVLDGFGDNNTIVVVQLFGAPKPPQVTTVAPVTIQEEPIEQTTPEVISSEAIIQERVLSESTNARNSLEEPVSNTVGKAFGNFVNYFAYNYDNAIKNIVYGLAIVVIGMLLLLIFFSPNMRFNGEFIIRSASVLVVLFAASIINKELFLIIIPHQIFI